MKLTFVMRNRTLSLQCMKIIKDIFLNGCRNMSVLEENFQFSDSHLVLVFTCRCQYSMIEDERAQGIRTEKILLKFYCEKNNNMQRYSYVVRNHHPYYTRKEKIKGTCSFKISFNNSYFPLIKNFWYIYMFKVFTFQHNECSLFSLPTLFF